jgi:hypothetical protein
MATSCIHCDCDRTFVTDEAALDHANLVHTFREIEEAVSLAIRAKYGRESTPTAPSIWTWVNDLSDDAVVFSVEQGNGPNSLYASTYSINEDGAVELGDPIEVKRKTVYVPISSI